MFETDCATLPVNHLQNVTLDNYVGLSATIRADADFENWVFFRLSDPAQAKLRISSVVRSDGKILNSNNYWTNIRYSEPDNAKFTYLNIFDFVALGQYQYVVTYETLVSDTTAPVTNLRFSGEFQITDEAVYLQPETQIFFLVEDGQNCSRW